MAGDMSWKSGSVRSQPWLSKENESRRFGEVAGGTTAECAAVVCCPCALVNLAVLALVKLPAGLSKKAWRKAKGKRKKKISRAGQGKNGDNEHIDAEDSSVASSQDGLLTSKRNVNILVLERTPSVTPEKFWEEIAGKSYVGFWRNLSLGSRGSDSGSRTEGENV